MYEGDINQNEKGVFNFKRIFHKENINNILWYII